MKRKIAILTRRAGYNMGSSLQAFAMGRFISKAGYNATILDYDEYAQKITWRIKPLIYKIAYNLMRVIAPLSKLVARDFYTKLDRRFSQERIFKQFEAKWMPLSSKTYKSMKGLRTTIGQYDAYVCGSDQIWNPAYFDPNFIMNFIRPSDGVLTVAYAPSIGVVDRESLLVSEQEMICRVDHISCREREGANVLAQITGRDIPVVLDPTLMLEREDWEQIESDERKIEGDYILTYFLHNDVYFEPQNLAIDFVEQLRQKTGLKVVNIQMFNQTPIINADINLYTEGPSEFLSLISGAKYVCTNSFHCCVFSFQYNKKFYVFERYSKEIEKHINQNPRIYTLLDTIGSRESLITELGDIDIDQNKDYSQGREKLAQMQRYSLEYLNNSLKSLSK